MSGFAERAAELAAEMESEAHELEVRAARLKARAAGLRAECLAAAPTQRPGPTERTVSVADAARQLGCGEQTLREDIRRGRVRSIRVGRRILIPRTHLEELISGGARA